MDKNNTKHIDDDFLKGLISLPQDETLPGDFTQKVMAALPKNELPAEVSPKRFNFMSWAIVAVLGIAAAFLIFTIDFRSILNATSEPTQNNPINYLNMITSVLNIFKEGFSGFKISSVTIVALLSLVSLYVGDKLLRKRFDQKFMFF
jgi:heme/copper-type cytochrome/quinol oxidase subunit 2